MRTPSNSSRRLPASSLRRLAVVLCLGIAPVACIQPPTSTASVSDMRPGLAFKATSALDAAIFIDGQSVGTVGQYLEGESLLRVLPGTHQVQVMRGSTVLVDERVYVADGVNKTIRVD